MRRPGVKFFGLTAALAVVLAACQVGPDYHPPAATTQPVTQWKSSSPWKEAQPSDAVVKHNFWEMFNDPILNSLEEQAATNSPDVQAALARVDQARAVARISRADLFPNASFDPSANRTHYSAGRSAQPGATVLPYTGDAYYIPVDLSYEVDLWGRVRRSFRAAREQAQASAAAYQNVLLSLQANLAETYFMIRTTDLDRDVLAATVDLREKNLSLVESLHQGGADSAVDVAQAQTELSSAQADLVGLLLQRTQLENALGVYCGVPSSRFRLEETNRIYDAPPIPVGLPSEMLERRPDVAQAERTMAASSEQIGVAQAAFFPTITLTGTAGTESVALKDIFNWENRTWSFGPNLTLPLFEGGRNRANLDRSKAAYDESVAQYRSQVLVAFHEVEDSLAALSLLGDQYDNQMAAVNAAKRVSDLSRNRYKEGLASYIEVVIADRTWLENEITAYQLNGDRLVATIQLVKAIGGGWSTNTPLMTNGIAPLSK